MDGPLPAPSLTKQMAAPVMLNNLDPSLVN